MLFSIIFCENCQSKYCYKYFQALELKSMDVSIDKTGQGSNQKIVIGVNDAITNDPLTNSAITGSINEDPFSGTTDSLGKFSALYLLVLEILVRPLTYPFRLQLTGIRLKRPVLLLKGHLR